MSVHGKTPLLVKCSLPKTGGEDLSPSSPHLAMKHLCRGGPPKPGVLWALAGGQGLVGMLLQSPPCTPRGRKGLQVGGDSRTSHIWPSRFTKPGAAPGAEGTSQPHAGEPHCPGVPSPARRGAAGAPATPNARQNTGETLGSLTGGPVLATVPSSRDLGVN